MANSHKAQIDIIIDFIEYYSIILFNTENGSFYI